MTHEAILLRVMDDNISFILSTTMPEQFLHCIAISKDRDDFMDYMYRCEGNTLNNAVSELLKRSYKQHE